MCRALGSSGKQDFLKLSFSFFNNGYEAIRKDINFPVTVMEQALLEDEGREAKWNVLWQGGRLKEQPFGKVMRVQLARGVVDT